MNRSVLIVMCDFIVISMLSMITGLSTLQNPYGDDGAVVNTKTANVIIEKLRTERVLLQEAYKELKLAQQRFGFSQARDAAMKKLEQQIAEAGVQLALLEERSLKKVIATEKKSLSSNKADLNTQYKNVMDKIGIDNEYGNGSTDNLITNLDGNFGNGTASDGNSDKNSSPTKIGLFTKVAKADDSEELKTVKDILSRKEVDLAHTKDELKESEEKVKKLDSEKERLNVQIGQYKENISNINQKAKRANDRLVFAKHRLVNSQKEVKVKVLQINENRKQINSMRKFLQNAVKDLSKTKREVVKEQQKHIVIKDELKDAKADLQQIKNNLNSDVLITYSKTIKEFQISTLQKRFFFDYSNSGTYYLPIVKLHNRYMAISLFSLLSGNTLDKIECKNIKELNWYLKEPDDEKSKTQKLLGPLFISRKDIRVGLLEVPKPPEQTLEFLTVSNLRRRGLHDLYLFKVNEFGKSGGYLSGRCSMSLRKSDQYLYIRNGSQDGIEAWADAGDIVMTKEGGFVGIIVENKTLENGINEAKCFVFPDDFLVRNSIKLPVNKDAKSGLLKDFEIIGTDLVERIKKNE